MKHLFRFWVFIFAMSLMILPCNVFSASKQLAKQQVWRWGHHTSDLDTLDPAFAVPDMTYSAGNSVFNGLVRLKPGTLDFDHLEGDLAESWEISPDGRVYTFHLRRGVKWHRGYGEFTAEDVKYTFDRLKNPKLGTPYAAKFLIIDEVKVIDRYTVQIILKSPSTFFLMDQALAYQAGMIVCKKQGEEKGMKNLGLDVIGTGPFMFEDYKAKEKITFVRNPDYFRGAPILERLEMYFMPNVASRTMAFIKGDLDAIYGKRDSYWVDDVKKTKTVIVDAVPLGSGCAIHFNMTKKPLDNIKVRKALAMTADRRVFKDFFGDIWTEMTAPVPPSYYAALPKNMTPKELLYQGTVEEAKKLLAEAGYGNGFKISAYITTKPYYKAILEICQELWKPLGVELEIKVVDHTTYHANIRKDMNHVVVYYAGRAPVADSYLTQWYYSKSAIGQPTQVTNFSHYGEVDADGDGKIDSVDDLIEAARSELDREKQKKMYYEAQLKILEDVPSKPLHELTKVFARHNWFDPGVEIKGSMIFGYPLEKAKILTH
ncbi:MAG: polyamine ABC transporter substrate-binding protein [Deltaproteobacteria bacterium]|nr:polyamine ABC transporter substrate-binding protein [Deltaproteobacteria bacterium]